MAREQMTRGRRRILGLMLASGLSLNKETDWRVDSSPPAAAAFISLAKDPYFNP